MLVIPGVGPHGATPTAEAMGTPASDDFSTNDYTGGTGWSGATWIDSENGVPTSGKIQVSGQQLVFDNLDSATLTRNVDLSAFTDGAALSFLLVDSNHSFSGAEVLDIEVAAGGGSFITIGTITTEDLPDGTTVHFNIPAAGLIAAGMLRFSSGSGTWSSGEFVTIDDVLIDNQRMNPPLAAACGIDVEVILDESGSIDQSNSITQVTDATAALADGLNGTTSSLRFSEFSTNGRSVEIGGSTAFQEVDDAYINPALATYLAGGGTPGNPATYQPLLGDPEQYTNWEAGLAKAIPGTPLVVFTTDGEPNTLGTDGSAVGGAVSADAGANAAIDDVAALQAAGSKVLGITVGAGSSAANLQRLADLIEPNPANQEIWTGPADGPLDLATVDVIAVTNFEDLEDALRVVVFALCAPSLALTKVDQDGQPIDGWNFDATVAITEAGQTATDYEWVHPVSGTAGPPDGLGQTQTGTTTGTGVTLFQWTPNTVADPEIWTSQVTFTETLPPEWVVADPQPDCTVERPGEADLGVDLDVSQTGQVVTFTIQDDGTTDQYVVQKSDIIKCNVVNNRLAEITIVKNAIPDGGTDFGFTTTSPAGAVSPLPATFTLDDDADGTFPNSETFLVSPGLFTVTENDPSGQFFELTNLQCSTTAGSPSAQTDEPARTATIGVAYGDALTCTYTNTQAPDPALEVTKTASPLTFQEPNGTIVYTVLVGNPNGASNPVTISGVAETVTVNSGTPIGPIDLSQAAPFNIAAGQDVTASDCNGLIGTVVGASTVSCTFTVSYTGANNADVFDDVVTVSGTDSFGRPVSDDDPAQVTVTPRPPQILVQKFNVEPTAIVAPGGIATYSVIVTNPAGSLEPLTLTAVADQMFQEPPAGTTLGGPLTITTVDGTTITASTCGTDGTNGALIGTVLQPGDSYTCEFSVDTNQLGPLAQGDILRNFVEVTGEDDDPLPTVVSDDDNATRIVLGEDPKLGIFKTDMGATIPEPGANIVYTIDIFNLGETEALTITKIQDLVAFTPLGGTITNEGLLVIEEVGGSPVVTYTPVGASTLVGTTCDAELGTVLAPAASIGGDGRPTNPDATTSCTVTLNLPGNAGDLYSDIIVVDAVDETGDQVRAESTDNTPVTPIDPDVEIVKTPSPTSVPETGGLVTFTLDITNTSISPTDPITITGLADTIFGNLLDAGNTAVQNNTCPALAALPPIAMGATVQCTFQATISGTVAVPHQNTVTVTAVDDELTEVGDSDPAEVTFTDVLPVIDVDKTANPTNVPEYGDAASNTVTYTVLVTNTGLEPATVSSLVDNVFGDITNPGNSAITGTTCTLGSFMAGGGGTYECTFTAIVEQQAGESEHVNVVTAQAIDDEGNPSNEPTDPATVTFDLIPPTVVIAKDDLGVEIDEPGGPVTYFLAIENTSGEAVTITSLEDVITYVKSPPAPPLQIGPFDLLGVMPAGPINSSTCDPVVLAPADGTPGSGPDYYECQFEAELAGTSQLVGDQVDVVVTDDDAETGTALATESTPILDVPPVVELFKTVTPTQIEPGENVDYTYVVQNRSTIEPLAVISLFDLLPTSPIPVDLTATCGFDVVPPIWLDPDDGVDGSGTDQVTCSPITRAPGVPAGENPSNYDHTNVATVEGADDEILDSQSGENPLPYVTDDDDATVMIREPGSVEVRKEATPPGQEFTFGLTGQQDQSTVPTAGAPDIYPPIIWDDLDPGTFDLTETIPPFWTLTGITCSIGTTEVPTTPITDGVQFELDWGEDVVCVATDVERKQPYQIIVTPTTDTNRLTDDHTYTVELRTDSDDDGALDELVVGATVDLSWTGPAGSQITDVNGTPITPTNTTTCVTQDGSDPLFPEGTCKVVVDSPTNVESAAALTASFTLPDPGSGVPELPTGDFGTTCTNPTEVGGVITVCNAVQDVERIEDSGDKTWVGYEVTVEPDGTNPLGAEHIFTIDVVRTDGTTETSAADGTVVNFGWSGPTGSQVIEVNGAPDLDATSCTTVSGSCTVTVDSDTNFGSGTLTVTTVEGDLIGVGVRAETPTPDSDLTASKTWVDWRVTATPQSATNAVNQDHTFMLLLERNDGTGGWVAETAGSIDVSWAGPAGSTITAVSAGTIDVPPTTATCDVDGSGECTVTVSSTTNGAGTLTATSVNVSLPGYSPPGAAPGAAFDFDIDDETADKTWVAIRGTVTADGVNIVGEAHDFTLLVETQQVDGAWIPAPAGTVATFTWTGAGAVTVIDEPDSDPMSCTLRDDDPVGDLGTCVVTVESTTPGSGTLSLQTVTSIIIDSEQLVPPGGSLPIADADPSMEVDSRLGFKTWVQFVVDVQSSATNLAGDPHEFTITASYDNGSTVIPVPDGSTATYTWGPDGAAVPPTGCTFAAGTCTVTVSSATPGSGTLEITEIQATIDGDIITGDPAATPPGVIAATDGSLEATKTWIEVRADVQATATNLSGDDHIFTLSAFITDDGTTEQPANGAIFDFTWTGTTATPATTCTAAPTENTCEVTVSSAVAASATLTIDTVTVTAADGTTFTDVVPTAATGGQLAATKTWIAFDVDITPLTALNPRGEEHIFTITVRVDDGSGLGELLIPPNSGSVEWSFDATDGSTIPGSCTLTAGGDCDVAQNSAILGTGTLTATALTVDYNGTVFGPIDLTATGSGQSPDLTIPPTAEKIWGGYELVLDPETAVNLWPTQPDHVVTLTLDAVPDTPLLPIDAQDLDVTLTSTVATITAVSNGTIITPTTATCTTDAVGECEVTITSTGPGAATLSASYTATIGNFPPILIPADNDADKIWRTFRVNVTPQTAQNLLGVPHTFTVTVEQTDDGTTWTPVEGAVPTTVVSAPAQITGETCSAGTDASGECTVTTTSPTAAEVTLSATYIGSVDSATAEFGDEGDKSWIDYLVEVDPPSAENLVGTQHVFTVSVRVDRGGGAGFEPIEGAIPAIVLAGPGEITGETCSSGTAADGTCTVTITSTTPGLLTVTASFEGTAGDGESETFSGAGEKTWIDYRIDVDPDIATNNTGDPHVFTVTLEADRGNGFGPASGETVQLAATGVGQIIGIDAAGGPASTCATDGNGQCRVTVNSTSAGSLTLTAVYDAVAGGTERVFADSGQKNWIDQDLPSTGGSAGRIIRIAAASMLLGLLLVLIARRRRSMLAAA
jgi:uncharacterized repeat protein (TIGR01451 family)/LPXTG-motif cell wall-anchored protein